MLPVIGTDPIRFNLNKRDSRHNHQNPPAESSLNCTDCGEAENPSITLYPITGKKFVYFLLKAFLIEKTQLTFSSQLSLIDCFVDSNNSNNAPGHRFYLQKALNYHLYLLQPDLGPKILLFHQKGQQSN